MNRERKNLMRDFASEAGHLADAFERGAPAAVAFPDWGGEDDVLPIDLPDDMPETPDRGGADLDFSALGNADLGEPEPLHMPDSLGVAEALADLPSRLSDDADYHGDPERAEMPQVVPGEREFAQWSEQDGSVVFEDGPGMQQDFQTAPEPTTLPQEPEGDVLGGALGDIFGLLEGIAAGIAAMGGKGQQGGAQGLNLPTGAVQLPWSGMRGPPTPEDMETYAAASPSIMDATTLGGARGAGGHGYGSRPGVPHIDLTEPGKRLSSHGGMG